MLNKIPNSFKEVSMIKDLLVDAEKRMRSAIQSLEEDFSAVRTGLVPSRILKKLSCPPIWG